MKIYTLMVGETVAESSGCNVRRGRGETFATEAQWLELQKITFN